MRRSTHAHLAYRYSASVASTRGRGETAIRLLITIQRHPTSNGYQAQNTELGSLEEGDHRRAAHGCGDLRRGGGQACGERGGVASNQPQPLLKKSTLRARTVPCSKVGADREEGRKDVRHTAKASAPFAPGGLGGLPGWHSLRWGGAGGGDALKSPSMISPFN